MQIKIKKLKPDCILPSYAHPGDVGLDLYSLEDYELKSGEHKVFYLGFALEFTEGFAAIIKDRGSMSVKYGIHTGGGVFDAGFHGEYNVLLMNLSNQSHQIEKGDKIAQLVIFPVAIVDLKKSKV